MMTISQILELAAGGLVALLVVYAMFSTVRVVGQQTALIINGSAALRAVFGHHRSVHVDSVRATLDLHKPRHYRRAGLHHQGQRDGPCGRHSLLQNYRRRTRLRHLGPDSRSSNSRKPRCAADQQDQPKSYFRTRASAQHR
jgi:hypothetical protein